ncbi:PadR family transcriptional regulator [Pseudovibrio sp. Tun.PSC04-5.I4]|uniref:PadR family transcriptional regulator n=1 Tax=Pseudovibrio sp. Tun.PSC04-5.I4 TaxID=1798213 RepID=UPI0008915FC6|nr:PadR family transcriptional regulator [Pseudovibrio sp. Tun.PSC04-5.I4]SDR29262.1 Transcriptional regulator PadR-like family protein [Pseudovibrio sp. Tun.PSC04-5.I4]
MSDNLTDSELLVLGLVSEMPRHGYELEQVIEQRGMREWTQIGFSSIYFVLGKLEKKDFVTAEKPSGAKAKKSYIMTSTGRDALVTQTLTAIKTVRPTYSSILLGMAHWPTLTRQQALSALRQRGEALQTELSRIENILIDQQPLPDHVEALFNFSIGQLKAEADWLHQTLDYMTCKPWNR